ncbi:AMP-binding protein [Halosegnis sp.]|uniref:AMP-binding protein n=1 Tax=Halosegnis sp. TaxID=2864959 RepID=UPI0035D4D56D
MAWHVDLGYETYEAAREQFEWNLPDDYNIVHDLLRKHEDTDATALVRHQPDGSAETYSFADLDRLSDRVARALANRGVTSGDRVGVVLPQRVENPLTHLACWKIGAVSLPLSVLFGPEALESRLADSDAVAVVASADVREAVAEAATACPDLQTHIEVGGDDSDRVEPFDALLDAPADFDRCETTAETPAIIMYTSGSTGPPKGVLHGHGVWVGHLPAFQMYFELDVEGVFWTPADWAWIGALGDLLFPAWHYGQPVVGYPIDGFDVAEAYEIMATHDVTNAFLPPTAIRMLMNGDPDAWNLSLEAICSGGEPLTPEILEWADAELGGVPVNELYGQTEANLLVANCRQWFDAQAGSMGKPVPGHEVAPIDPETGEPMPVDEVGHLAVKREDDPVVFAEYWNRPEKTAAATVNTPDDGTWHLTGDLGHRDADGYLWFKARDDDVIITSGYRVGPGEVESAILEHPAVEQVGVVGVDDELRGEIIKAFVQPVADRRDPVRDPESLREEIRAVVRENLAKHEYPREIEFVDELPQTTTGKIKRRELRPDE